MFQNLSHLDNNQLRPDYFVVKYTSAPGAIDKIGGKNVI